MKSTSFNKSIYLTWDAHACPTLELNADLSALFEFKKEGFNFISLNVGFEPQTKKEVLEIINSLSTFLIQNKNNFVLVKKPNEILLAKKNNQLAISFDIEGLGPYESDLSNLELLYHLGVKQIAPVYNMNNGFGGGCFDDDAGLTTKGYDFIREMNRLGILIDCSHMGYKTSLDVINYSTAPVIFSHSNPKTLCSHQRNIPDELIIACAKNNGVIGLNGINIFLANNQITAENFVNHIDYIVNLVGIDHVGFGFDFVFEHEKTLQLVKDYPDKFPNGEQYNNIKMISPSYIDGIIKELVERSYSADYISKIIGGNFFRVASDVWGKAC